MHRVEVQGANLEPLVTAYLVITFAIAALGGFFGYISKYVWLDLGKARKFAMLGIAGTIAFMVVALIVL